jgi:hypothetical protein
LPDRDALRRSPSRFASDIFTLARKGRAFASLDALITCKDGQNVLAGSAHVLPPPCDDTGHSRADDNRHAERPVVTRVA